MPRALTAKQVDKFIESIYREDGVGNRVQIDIMDIGKIFAAGRTAYARAVTMGLDVAAEVRTALIAKVGELRKN